MQARLILIYPRTSFVQMMEPAWLLRLALRLAPCLCSMLCLVRHPSVLQAVLCTAGQVRFATEDHKPQSPEESARVKAAGGFVIMGRVCGNLAVSRALGDYDFKDRPDLPPDQQKIGAGADVTVCPCSPLSFSVCARACVCVCVCVCVCLSLCVCVCACVPQLDMARLRRQPLDLACIAPHFIPCGLVVCHPHPQTIERKLEDQFLIIACDGIWDVMSNVQVVQFITKYYNMGHSISKITNKLLDACLKKGSTDNMTAIIIRLHTSDSRKSYVDRTGKLCEPPSRITMCVERAGRRSWHKQNRLRARTGTRALQYIHTCCTHVCACVHVMCMCVRVCLCGAPYSNCVRPAVLPTHLCYVPPLKMRTCRRCYSAP